MKTATKHTKIRSPLKWHGGKSYLAKWIVSLFPPHRRYLEGCAGGLSVLLNKPRCEVEVVSDLNNDLVRFWLALRDRGDWLRQTLAVSPYDKKSFDASAEHIGSRFMMDHAAAFMIRNRMSIGGMGKAYSWSDRLRGGQPENLNSWDTIRASLPRVVERLQGVGVVNRPASAMINEYHEPGDLIYLDPPYMHETRTARNVYDFEMTRADHWELLMAAADSPAKVFISGYRSDLYDQKLSGWTRHDREIANHSGVGKTKQRRVECLWESPS